MAVFFLVNALLGAHPYRQRLEHIGGAEPASRAGLRARARRGRRDRPRQRLSCSHRRGSALRRHGSLRAPAHPGGLAVPRPARARLQLPRPGRADPQRPEGGRQSLLSPGAGLGPDAADHPGDRRHRDREPGGDHRRLLARKSGDPARSSAAARDRSHLPHPGRPDLHPTREPDSAFRSAGAGAYVPLVRRPRQRLWHCRFGHDGRDDGSFAVCCMEALALAAVGGLGSRLRLPFNRHRLFRRQPLQGSGRRLGPADARRIDVHPDVDLVARERHSHRQNAPRQHPNGRPHQNAGEVEAGASARNGGVPHQRPDLGAFVADAQSQAQQGLARARGAAERPHRDDAAHRSSQPI